jgi:hypothetical protein
MEVTIEGGALSPPAFVRVCLEESRRQGLPFMAAWTHALHSLPRGTSPAIVSERKAWVRELKWSRPAWQAYYEGRELADFLAGAAAAGRELRAAA